MTAKKIERCLVLEDEPVIQLSVRRQLITLGISEVDMFATVSDTIDYLEEMLPDFALLDHHLARSETSDLVAARLHARKVPFAIMTGLGELWKSPSYLEDVPVVSKPMDLETLRKLLMCAA